MGIIVMNIEDDHKTSVGVGYLDENVCIVRKICIDNITRELNYAIHW